MGPPEVIVIMPSDRIDGRDRLVCRRTRLPGPQLMQGIRQREAEERGTRELGGGGTCVHDVEAGRCGLPHHTYDDKTTERYVGAFEQDRGYRMRQLKCDTCVTIRQTTNVIRPFGHFSSR
jgi:hypothetical protein